MAANYYKLKGKVWGRKKGQTKYPLLHTSNGGVTDGDKKKKKNLQNNLQTQLVCI